MKIFIRIKIQRGEKAGQWARTEIEAHPVHITGSRYRFAAHRDINAINEWTVTELSSGAALGWGDTQEEATQSARKIWKENDGDAGLEKKIAEREPLENLEIWEVKGWEVEEGES